MKKFLRVIADCEIDTPFGLYVVSRTFLIVASSALMYFGCATTPYGFSSVFMFMAGLYCWLDSASNLCNAFKERYRGSVEQEEGGPSPGEHVPWDYEDRYQRELSAAVEERRAAQGERPEADVHREGDGGEEDRRGAAY